MAATARAIWVGVWGLAHWQKAFFMEGYLNNLFSVIQLFSEWAAIAGGDAVRALGIFKALGICILSDIKESLWCPVE